MKLDFSLIGHTSRKALEDAQRAERQGFDGVWATESVTDAFLQSMAIALTTDRVDIGTDGLKLRFRDKGLAQMVAEVGLMTGKSRREAA